MGLLWLGNEWELDGQMNFTWMLGVRAWAREWCGEGLACQISFVAEKLKLTTHDAA